MQALQQGGIEAREYQRAIAKSALAANTLVVLPTGLGKTIVALLVAADRLTGYPQSKILILAPTRPLVLQHAQFFTEQDRKSTRLNSSHVKISYAVFCLKKKKKKKTKQI